MSEQNQQPANNPFIGSEPPSYDLGGGTAAVPAVTPSTTPATPVTPTPITPATPTSTTLDKESIRELVTGVARAVAPKEKAPEMSMEEFNRVMNVLNITPEYAQKLGLNPEAAPVLQELFQGIAKQAVTMATYQINQARQELETRFNAGLTPLQQHIQKQVEGQAKDEFMKAYPDLKGFEPVLELVYAQMKTEGYQAKTKEEAFKAVADRAQTMIKTLPGMTAVPVGTVKQAGQPTPGQGAHRMSTLSGGGQGGVGGSSGGTRKSTSERLFGDMPKQG